MARPLSLTVDYHRHLSLGLALALSLTGISRAEEEPAAKAPEKSASSSAATSPTPITAEQEKFFETKVRPLLVSKCSECHGDKKQESGFRVDSRAAMIAGGDSGDRAIVPGQLDQGLLLKAIRHDGDIKMPPNKKMPDAEVAILTDWVKQGAPWPASAAAPAAALSGDALYKHQKEKHWSLQPIKSPAPPVVKNEAWATTPIDRFVLAKLEAGGLAPSPDVDRRVLLRRVTFDLIGLPPTPEEVEAFIKDASPDAYEKVVQRLLDSPRYGERWGRHWLDVARYADTRGYSFGKERRFPYSYTYRDYVIRAMNADMPYNRFVMEQLAGDQLPLPESGDNRQLAALGFLTVGRKFDNGPDDIDDQIDAISRGLIGLTVSCARCHDHKFDAISTEDYYSLFGVLNSSEAPAKLPLVGKPEDNPEYPKFKEELDKRTAALESFRAKKYEELIELNRKMAPAYFIRVALKKEDELKGKEAELSLSKEDLRPQLVQKWRQYFDAAKPADPVLGLWAELVKLDDKKPDFADKAEKIIAGWKARPAGTQPNQANSLITAALTAQPIKSRADIGRLYGKAMQDVYTQHQAAKTPLPAKPVTKPETKPDTKPVAQVDSAPPMPQPAPSAPPSPEAEQLLQLFLAANSPTIFPREELKSHFVRIDAEKDNELKKKVDELEVNSPGAPPRAMSLVDKKNPHNARVFIRGNPGRPGKEVPRQFVKLVAGESRKPFPNPKTSGRLDLARAIAADDNPLTARVIVNRIWMHHFNQALVTTPSDFGLRGEQPSHPELLDWLASNFKQNGWSMKWLHKQIVMSHAYRQASNDRADARQKDPENRLLWRMNPRRLELEALRDSLLAVAGRLDLSMYGRPVNIATDAENRRRTVYGLIDRQDLPGIFRTFDFASPDQSTPQRPQTTVPQQALFLMNSSFMQKQAAALAARPEVANAKEPAERVKQLYRLSLVRDPSPEETDLAVKFIAAAEKEKAKETKLGAWEQLAQVLLMSDEFAYID